jgi:hypothetical protein
LFSLEFIKRDEGTANEAEGRIMQDTDPFFDPQLIMRKLAEEVWPNLNGTDPKYGPTFPELFAEFDRNGNPVPKQNGEPLWETVTWGYTDGNFTIRPGTDLNFSNHIFFQFGRHYLSIDQWGDVYRYVKPEKQKSPKNRYERRLALIVADVLRDIRAEAEPLHVEASEFNREFWG